ncbi:MAG: DUF5947 family protein [Nocardioidaceae bacterium]
MTTTNDRSAGNPLDVLRRITTSRPAPFDGERCEMCAAPIEGSHQHVVDLESRSLMCTCRGCYLLFTSESARQRFCAVPERYLSFADFELGPGQWDALEIPIGLAFFFHNSTQERTFAFYPGPAGATESELPLDAWETVAAANPGLAVAAPDVEALLIRSGDRSDCHLVPIDACYELVGRLRKVWRGFDGGQDARAQIAEFFDAVDARSRPASASSGGVDG